MARATTTWAMPQLEDGVRHGFEVSRFPDFWPFFFWGGTGILPTGLRHVPGFLRGGGVWGLFSSIFFSTSFKQTKKKKPYLPDREVSLIKKEYCRLSV